MALLVLANTCSFKNGCFRATFVTPFLLYFSDQDPIKGSRTSMDMSDKPMESEGGSMDEYGDIDPGRFNEDGSFIGQYGKSSTNIDVWKVFLLSIFFAQSAKLSSSMLSLLCQA